MHYQRNLRGGDMDAPQRPHRTKAVARPVCSVSWCEDAVSGKGLCGMHLARQRNGINMDQPKKHRRKKGEPPRICVIDGCGELRKYSNGMCPMHALRAKKGTDLLAPKRIRMERRVTDEGYVLIWRGDQQVAEHRVVMEEMLGRPLHPYENVHHKNTIRRDNSPGNLELWVKVQPAGGRVEDIVAWVMDTYPELAAEHLRSQLRAV
jgi:hypothetical protein